MERCTPCRRGAVALTEADVAELLPQVPGWERVERDGIPQLQRRFRFKNFAEALAWTNRIGVVAEAENHHPAILLEWGQVTVNLWTHTVRGLHRNDFVLARMIDELS